jgi:hypothetical protein
MCAVYSITNYVRRSTGILNKITCKCGGQERYGKVKQILKSLQGNCSYFLKKEMVCSCSVNR